MHIYAGSMHIKVYLFNAVQEDLLLLITEISWKNTPAW